MVYVICSALLLSMVGLGPLSPKNNQVRLTENLERGSQMKIKNINSIKKWEERLMVVGID